VQELRIACAEVARRARHVVVNESGIPEYAASLAANAGLERNQPEDAPDRTANPDNREETVAFWLTLDAINFGSGWFPTLRKRPGSSGYQTIAAGVRERFARNGAWSAEELRRLAPEELAEVLGQDVGHELIGLFAGSLNELGARVQEEFEASFAEVVDAAGGSARRMVKTLAAWDCFRDCSRYDELTLSFLKRAQIAAADVHRARVVEFGDIAELTMFADNLVPHVLRLDGILEFDRRLAGRIERGELIRHGSPEEVEIRACAVHAVELVVAQRPGVTAMDVDEMLWLRGGQARYKASPRHRCRCTAY
jgi:Potential Queuosine, Q, salvage protein family